jgi:hypothetical protein
MKLEFDSQWDDDQGTVVAVLYTVKVHSHVCFKATYKLLSERLASSPLVESDFLATFKLLCSTHVNVP